MVLVPERILFPVPFLVHGREVLLPDKFLLVDLFLDPLLVVLFRLYLACLSPVMNRYALLVYKLFAYVCKISLLRNHSLFLEEKSLYLSFHSFRVMFFDTLDALLSDVHNPYYVEDHFPRAHFLHNKHNLIRAFKEAGGTIKNLSAVSSEYTGFVRNDMRKGNHNHYLFFDDERENEAFKQKNKDFPAIGSFFVDYFFLDKGVIAFTSNVLVNIPDEDYYYTFFSNNSCIEFNYYYNQNLAIRHDKDSLETRLEGEELERVQQVFPLVSKKTFFTLDFAYDERNDYFLPGCKDEKIIFTNALNDPYSDEILGEEETVSVTLEKQHAAYAGVLTGRLFFSMPKKIFQELILTQKDTTHLSVHALNYYAGTRKVRTFGLDAHLPAYYGERDSFDGRSLGDVLNIIQEKTNAIAALYNDPRFAGASRALFEKLRVVKPGASPDDVFTQNKADSTILNTCLRQLGPFASEHVLKQKFFSYLEQLQNAEFKLVDLPSFHPEYQAVSDEVHAFMLACKYPELYDLRGELMTPTKYHL